MHLACLSDKNYFRISQSISTQEANASDRNNQLVPRQRHLITSLRGVDRSWQQTQTKDVERLDRSNQRPLPKPSCQKLAERLWERHAVAGSRCVPYGHTSDASETAPLVTALVTP